MESENSGSSSRRSNGNVRTLLSVIVQDSGIGIRTQDIEKLFQPFAKLPDSRQLNPNG